MVDGWQTDKASFPYRDILYLDVIALPNGNAEIIDDDDLELALKTGAVSKLQYEAAWREAEVVLAALESQTFALLERAAAYLNLFDIPS